MTEPAAWMQTYTGRKFDLAAPRPEDVDLADIAHALGNLCRFNGHVRTFYSVAQHSMLVAANVPPELRLAALLHDAAEAYTGDVIRPLKRHPAVREALRGIEADVERAIAMHFGIDVADLHHPLIKSADNRALATERRDLHHPPPEPWVIDEQGVDPFEDRIVRMSPHLAAAEYLYEVRDLTWRQCREWEHPSKASGGSS